jgi:hypothetical protein
MAPSLTTDGPLYRYCKNPDAEHCPGDTRYQLPASQNGGNYSGPYAWDSYSGVEYLNGEQWWNANGYNIPKRPSIGHPDARFVWVEGEDMRGENLGSWEMQPVGTPAQGFTDTKYGDSPAAFHITSSIFPFCDGHVENHKWADQATIAYAQDPSWQKDGGGAGGTQSTANGAAGVDDRVWLGMHYPGNQNP